MLSWQIQLPEQGLRKDFSLFNEIPNQNSVQYVFNVLKNDATVWIVWLIVDAWTWISFESQVSWCFKLYTLFHYDRENHVLIIVFLISVGITHNINDTIFISIAVTNSLRQNDQPNTQSQTCNVYIRIVYFFFFSFFFLENQKIVLLSPPPFPSTSVYPQFIPYSLISIYFLLCCSFSIFQFPSNKNKSSTYRIIRINKVNIIFYGFSSSRLTLLWIFVLRIRYTPSVPLSIVRLEKFPCKKIPNKMVKITRIIQIHDISYFASNFHSPPNYNPALRVPRGLKPVFPSRGTFARPIFVQFFLFLTFSFNFNV